MPYYYKKIIISGVKNRALSIIIKNRGIKVKAEGLKDKAYFIATGVLTGIVNGLFGGGGGMIVVPLMTFLLKMKTKVAHATALAVILPVSVISGIIYLIKGNFDLSVGLPSGIGVVIGGIVGAWALKKLSVKWVKIIFCGCMVFAGVKLLFF